MFEIDDINLPSSPILLNKLYSEYPYDCYSQDLGLICPESIFKCHTPRIDTAAPVSISIVKQFEYSPLIKQKSDCGFSQADYVYTTNSGLGSQFLMSSDKSLFSTPRMAPWRDIILDVNLRSSTGLTVPNLFSVSQFENFKSPPESAPEIENNLFKAVDVSRPRAEDSPINFQNSDSVDERTLTNTSCFVTLQFAKRKSFLAVVEISGCEREYNLPIFRKIAPLESMILSGKYNNPNQTLEEPAFKLEDLLSGKRFVSRLTRVQLSQLLGLQRYDISLVKDIEDTVFDLCNQLCGLKIGESSWSRNISRELRRSTINKVHKFAHIFFPSFTLDHVQTIIKRGAYVRTQEFLRRKRRRAKRVKAESKLCV